MLELKSTNKSFNHVGLLFLPSDIYELRKNLVNENNSVNELLDLYYNYFYYYNT